MRQKQEKKRKRDTDKSSQHAKRQKIEVSDPLTGQAFIKAFKKHYDKLSGDQREDLKVIFSQKFDIATCKTGIFDAENEVETFINFIQIFKNKMMYRIFNSIISDDGFEFSLKMVHTGSCHQGILKLYQKNAENLYKIMQVLHGDTKIPVHKRFVHHGFDTGYVLEEIDNQKEKLRKKSAGDPVLNFQGADLETCYILCSRYSTKNKMDKRRAETLFDEHFTEADFKQRIYNAENQQALLLKCLDIICHEWGKLTLLRIFLRPGAHTITLDSRSQKVCQGIEDKIIHRFRDDPKGTFRKSVSTYLYSKNVIQMGNDVALETKDFVPEIEIVEPPVQVSPKKQHFDCHAPYLQEEEYALSANPQEIDCKAMQHIVQETQNDFTWLDKFSIFSTNGVSVEEDVSEMRMKLDKYQS